MSTDHTTVMTAIGQTKQHYRALGLTLPKALTDGLADADATLQRGTLRRFDPGAYLDAIERALDDGRDPADDETVRSQLTRKAIAAANTWPLLEGRAAERRAAALRASAADIISDLSAVVTRADATLTQARAAVPNLNPDDTDSVRSLSPGQVTRWAEARDAVDQVKRVRQIWHLIMNACNLARTDPRHSPLVLASLSADELDALPGTDVTAIVAAGHSLDLATPETYRERCQAVADQLAEQKAQREREARTGRREGATAA